MTASEGVTSLYTFQDEIRALWPDPKPLGAALSLACSPPCSRRGEPVSMSWGSRVLRPTCFLLCLLTADGRGAEVKLKGQRVCLIAHMMVRTVLTGHQLPRVVASCSPALPELFFIFISDNWKHLFTNQTSFLSVQVMFGVVQPS